MIMGILFLILVIVVMGLIWSLPLYLVVNLVLWLFGIEFHLTLLQAFGVCLLASVVKGLLGKGE
jgi:hypothetical protein